MSDEGVLRRHSLRVFMSYTSQDRKLATRIAQSLDDADVNIWGQLRLSPDEDSYKRINEAIRSNDVLLVFLSPRGAIIPWSRLEAEQALATRLDQRDIDIIPVLLAPMDVPAFLRDRGVIDLTPSNPDGLSQLIDRLRYSTAIDFRSLDPRTFELLVADLLRRLELEVVSELPRLDRGPDIEAIYRHKDPFGAVLETQYVVELKRYPHSRVSVAGIHQLLKSLEAYPESARGLLVTNSLLTSEARAFLEEQKTPTKDRLSVLDGSAMRRLLLKHPDLIERYFPVGSEPTGSGAK